MSLIKADDLKKLRLYRNLTQKAAASIAGVNLRTWKSYEAEEHLPSSREMPAPVLELFCLKTKIQYPPYKNNNQLVTETANVLTIISQDKGKNKISILDELACELCRQGSSVAVLTNGTGTFQKKETDISNRNGLKRSVVFDEMNASRERKDFLGPLFIDKKSVYFDTIKNNNSFDFMHVFSELSKAYDYILLDFDSDIDTIVALSDLIVLPCSLSGCSADFSSLHQNLNQIRDTGSITKNKLIALITERSTPDRTALLSALKNVNLSESQTNSISEHLYKSYLSQSNLLRKLKSQGIGILKSELTTSYEWDMLFDGEMLRPGESVLDFHPHSMLSIEIKSLCDEITTLLPTLNNQCL